MIELIDANFENYIGQSQGYSEMAYQMVAHVLTLGYAVMLAGLFYFILTIKSVAPKQPVGSCCNGLCFYYLRQANSRTSTLNLTERST
jgi:ABC-type xylose transport system permease subunit